MYLTIYIGTTNSLKVRYGSTQPTTVTTGPNDVRRVVWALGEFSLYFSFIHLILIIIFRYYNLQKGYLKPRRDVWKAMMRITGPNDARCVVWALGEFFYILFPSFISI